MNEITPHARTGSQRRVGRLREGLAPQSGHPVEMLETRIPCARLTGEYSYTITYRIKKAVAFGFLDFATSTAGKRTCDEEWRLDRPLPPAAYVDVDTIGGSAAAPTTAGTGTVQDHGARMREFPPDGLLSRVLARGALTAAHIDALAAQVAAFHARSETAPAGGPYGVPADILHYAVQNFTHLRRLAAFPSDSHALSALESWTRRAYAALRPALIARQRGGFIRACHGDLHLGNIALADDELTIRDSLESNPEPRWIDTMSEVACLAMDLGDRGRSDLANRFVNAYVEATGDYAGLAMLRFYLVYRAMVRARRACPRAAQLEAGEPGTANLDECRGYVNLARRYAAPAMGALVIAHGLPGSGKSTLAQALVEHLGAIRISADAGCRRVHGRASDARSGSAVGADPCGCAANERTYARLAEIARVVAEADHIAIADATFLRRADRDRFRALATTIGVPFAIVDCTAPEGIRRARVEARSRRGMDASAADGTALAHDLRMRDSLAVDEQRFAVPFDSGSSAHGRPDPGWWHALVVRLNGADDLRRLSLPFPPSRPDRLAVTKM